MKMHFIYPVLQNKNTLGLSVNNTKPKNTENGTTAYLGLSSYSFHFIQRKTILKSHDMT